MTYARSRSRIGARPRITRYARNNADTKALSNPLLQLPLYAGFWGDDPAWVGPGVGNAVSSWLTAGTLRNSGAYLDPSNGLTLPSVAGNYASVPDAAALDITGGICMVVSAALTDWTPAVTPTLISKYTSAGDQRSFAMAVSTGGVPQVWFSPDGTAGTTQFLGANNSNTPVPASDGQAIWLAVTAASDGGSNTVLTSWSSSDGVTWAQFGGTRTVAVVFSIFAGSAPVNFGANNAGTAGNLAGSLSVARIYSGSGFTTAGPSGTLVLDVDFRRNNTDQFTCSTGQTVTVSSTFNALQATAGSRPTLTTSALLGGRRVVDFDGTDDRLEITTGVSLAQPFEVWSVVVFDTTTNPAIVGLGSGSNTYRVGLTSTGPAWAARYGAAGSAITGGTPLVDTPYLARFVANGASSSIFANGTSVATGGSATDGIDQIIVGAGRTAPATYGFSINGKIAFLGILPAASITATHRRQFALWAASFYSVPGFAAAA